MGMGPGCGVSEHNHTLVKMTGRVAQQHVGRQQVGGIVQHIGVMKEMRFTMQYHISEDYLRHWLG
jgi:hypothetical protein